MKTLKTLLVTALAGVMFLAAPAAQAYPRGARVEVRGPRAIARPGFGPRFYGPGYAGYYGGPGYYGPRVAIGGGWGPRFAGGGFRGGRGWGGRAIGRR
jgi:hypothetical protein